VACRNKRTRQTRPVAVDRVVADELRDDDDCSFIAAVSVSDDDVPARSNDDQHDTITRLNIRISNVGIVGGCRYRFVVKILLNKVHVIIKHSFGRLKNARLENVELDSRGQFASGSCRTASNSTLTSQRWSFSAPLLSSGQLPTSPLSRPRLPRADLVW